MLSFGFISSMRRRASRTESGSSFAPSSAKIRTEAGKPKNTRLLFFAPDSSQAISAGFPQERSIPSSMTATRSAACKTASSRCSVSKMATPSSRLMRSTIARRFCAANGSSMAVGSSRMRIFGFIASAEAILSSCFCPPDSSHVFCRNHGSMPKNAAISATLRRMTGTGSARFSSPNASSCQTKSVTIWLSGFCWIKPISAAAVSAGNSASGLPL